MKSLIDRKIHDIETNNGKYKETIEDLKLRTFLAQKWKERRIFIIFFFGSSDNDFEWKNYIIKLVLVVPFFF